MAKVPIAPEAKNRSYYKYYEQGIADLTPEQLAFATGSKGKLSEGLEIADRNKVLLPGVLPEKSGFFPLEGGGMLVSGNIPLQGVTPEMLWWWWPWHSLEPLRYSIWDPDDHFDVQVNDEGRRRALDPSVPLEQKTWGATHYVKESVGGPPDDITIMFEEPAKLGYDWSKVGTPSCRFLVAANALMGSMKVPTVMTETASDIEGGVVFHARFWIGYHIIDGEAKYLLSPEVKLPEEVAIGLVGHNLKEFANLAKVLPAVYAEEKDNWGTTQKTENKAL